MALKFTSAKQARAYAKNAKDLARSSKRLDPKYSSMWLNKGKQAFKQYQALGGKGKWSNL